MPPRTLFALTLVVPLSGVALAASTQEVVPPPNAPATIEWNAEQGRLLLRYHDTPILAAAVDVENADGERIPP